MLDKLLRLLTLLIVNALIEILFGGNIPYMAYSKHCAFHLLHKFQAYV